MKARTLAGILVVVALAAGAALPSQAIADGLPVPGGVDTTGEGVVSASGAQRFLAVPHHGDTLVERIATEDGTLLDRLSIDGSFTVPGVSIAGDTDGLSEDGSALVLIRPRMGFPQAETSMIVVEPNSLKVERRITLDGDFSFDAISPDGRTAYVIEYPDRRDPTYYRLRTLDLASGRLAPGSLLPENDPDEEMRGFPMSRVAGLGSRWQYTLYDGGLIYGYGEGPAGEPFVHAIDTVGRRTLCIDLEWVPPARIDNVRLELDESGANVLVVDPKRGVLGTIDTATGEASEGPPPAAASEAGGGDSDLTWLVVAAAALLVLGGGVAIIVAWSSRSTRSASAGAEGPSSTG